MADDVAEDYRQALEDLSINSRLEISTLTNIARENADHGLAIADVLTAHIKKVPPPRTLPALYVLDSVVKNVPTPYALYFGPKLYTIFMGAYAKVDNPTRRKMDEMLKTWKEPVPGSISTKPVFPPEYVRPIENALIGARNAAMMAHQSSFQGQQQLLRRGPPAVPNRDTPTPPNGRAPSQFGAPPYAGHNGQMPPHGDPNMAQQPYPSRPLSATGQVPPRTVTQTPPTGLPHHLLAQQQQGPREVYGAPQPDINIDRLRDDIQQLIVAEKAEFVRDPHDASKQTRLRALLELQNLIQRPDVPRDQLMLVKDRVSDLAVNMRIPASSAGPPLVHHHAAAAAAPYTTTPTPPVMLSQQPTPVPPVAVARPPSASATGAPTLSIDNLFGQGALAALLGGIKPGAVAVGTPQPSPSISSTPQPLPIPLPVPAVAPVRPTPPPQVTTPVTVAPVATVPTSNPSALLAMLRQSGILGGAAPPPGSVTPTPVPAIATPTPPPPAVPIPALAPTAATAPPAPAAQGGGISLASLGLAGLLPQLSALTNANKPPTQPTPVLTTRPPLNPQSVYLKRLNPHQNPLSRLNDDLGPACYQCGRRFRTDESGRRKKTAHMDWHFHVHQRIAEAEKRGQHRSWYVGEMDWIRSREAVDVDWVAPEGSGVDGGGEHNNFGEGGVGGKDGDGSAGGKGGNGKAAAGNKVQYIPVPDDSTKVNSICPICQERFEMKWLDEAQEWVWMDAVRVRVGGGVDKVYHASCHREAVGGSGSTANGGGSGMKGGGRSTPEGVLGKRKAEDDFSPVMRGKLKMESGY